MYIDYRCFFRYGPGDGSAVFCGLSGDLERVYAHHGLRVLYLGSNDIRRVVDYTLDKIRFGVELTDNPNISIDLTTACPYITAGLASFLFDPGQDVRGCDAVVPKY